MLQNISGNHAATWQQKLARDYTPLILKLRTARHSSAAQFLMWHQNHIMFKL